MTFMEDREDYEYEFAVSQCDNVVEENERELKEMGFERIGGFVYDAYPVYRKGDQIVIITFHQITNYVYAEGEGSDETFEKLTKGRTERVHSIRGLLI